MFFVGCEYRSTWSAVRNDRMTQVSTGFHRQGVCPCQMKVLVVDDIEEQFRKELRRNHSHGKKKDRRAVPRDDRAGKGAAELIAAHKEQQGALMPVLQGAQEIYGYLPIEVQTIIAEELNIPLAEVYGVVTFYAQFTLNPRGTYNIGVCMGTACYVKGAGDVLERIQKRLGIEPGGTTPDGRFSLEATRCIGACGLAPVMTINEDVYGRLTPDEVDKILINTCE